MPLLIPIAVLLLLGLPLAGILMKGGTLSPYTEFPPMTQYIQHAPFAWPAFTALALLIIIVVGPFIIRVIQANFFKSRCHDGLRGGVT